MDILRENHMDIPVQAGTRIPAGRLRQVLKTHCKSILTGLYKVCHITMEGIVTIRPETCFLSVHPHPSLAHGTIEKEGHPLSLRDIEAAAIPSASHIRETTGTTGHDRRIVIVGLEIDIAAERSVDCPVMWDGDIFPRRIVITALKSPFSI